MFKKILTGTGMMALGIAMALAYPHLADARGGQGGPGMGPGGGQCMNRQGMGPGGGQGRGPNGNRGQGPGNNQGQGPGNSQGQGPGNDQGNGPNGNRKLDRFNADDGDRDGMISSSEFSGPAEHFNNIDTDGNGYISEEEALNYQPPAGGQRGPGGPGGPGMTN